jgi:hypothetical protein
MAKKSQKHTREDYIRRVRQEVLAYSGPTFLNMDTMTTRAAEKAFSSFKEEVIAWATVFGVVLALLAIFAPLGASYVDKFVSSKHDHDVQMEQRIAKDVEAQYEARLKSLSDQVEQLSKKPAPSGSADANANRR